MVDWGNPKEVAAYKEWVMRWTPDWVRTPTLADRIYDFADALRASRTLVEERQDATNIASERPQ